MRYLKSINLLALLLAIYLTISAIFEFLWIESFRFPVRVTIFYILGVTGYLLCFHWGEVPRRWVVIMAGITYALIVLIILLAEPAGETDSTSVGIVVIVMSRVIRLALLAPGVYSLWVFSQLINWKIQERSIK